MQHARHLAVLCTLLGAIAAQAPVLTPAATADLPGLRARLDQIAGQVGGAGIGLVVVRGTELAHRSVHGALATDAVLPVGAASQWLAVATVLTLVEEKVLDLDVPLARYVTEFERAEKSTLTLRQCLACTGGLPARLGDAMRGWTMTKFAEQAADAALRAQPGATFRHGGVGLQIAALAAERVTGKTWHELFADRIARPLGLKETKFGALQPAGADAGTTPLPWVASGAVSTLDDFTRFLRMLVGKGELEGRRVLDAASVTAMLRDQVPEHVDVQPVGFQAAKVRYGLGAWIETLPDDVVRASAPNVGAGGFSPWLDLDLDLAGVLVVQERGQRAQAQLRNVQDAVREALRSPAIAGTVDAVTLEHGGRERRYHLHAPPFTANAPGMPLLLVLHGGGGSGEQAREATGLAEAGVRAGYVVAFADGTGPVRGKLLTWNSGGIPVYAQEHDVDDVGFVRALVADVQRRVPIDAARTFAVGHSNGGMMCHRLARQAPELFAGIAVVGGAMNFTAADATTPIAVLIVHGTADDHVRFDGGKPRTAVGRAGERVDASVQAAIDYYVARNQLVGYPEAVVDGKVRIDTYATGKDKKPAVPLRVVTLEGGGHAWPGSPARARPAADAPFPFDASAAILAFFTELSAPRATGAGPTGR